MRDVQIYRRGQVYWRKDDNGKQKHGIINKARPVILVSNNEGLAYSDIATVVPLTSQTRKYLLCTQVSLWLYNKKNYALCEQVYTCSFSDLGEYVGTVNEDVMKKVDLALSYALGLKPLPASASNQLTSETEVTEAEFSPEGYNDTVDEKDQKFERLRKGSRSRRWSEEEKLELCIKAEEVKNDISAQTALVEEYKFSNFASLLSSVRRFKRQLGV